MPDSDRLREALEGYDRFIKPKDRPWQLAAVVAAAGRFLALTETGPDYEAALEAARIDEEENWAMAVAMDPKGFVRAVVDAALPDLTEEIE